MVCLNVPTLAGRVSSHLAGPMLFSAVADFDRGHNLAAACKLREAMKRHLTALCELYGCLPNRRPTPRRMLRSLERVDCGVCLCLVLDILEACEAIASLEQPSESLRGYLELAGDIIRPEFDTRKGGVL